MMTTSEHLAVRTAALTRYFGDIRAVDELELHVPLGSVYGFLGPNGAGKTTTIRLLLGLTRPDKGEVCLLGQRLTVRTRRELLSRVGALVETPSLYPHLNGRENLQVTQEFVGLPRTSIDRVLDTVGLRRDSHRLVRTYSLGMRQRLGLALALLGEPELLILDEPTNGLDPAGIHEMRNLLRELAAEHGISVFVSSHLLSGVEQMASHVGIIARGHLRAAHGHLPSREWRTAGAGAADVAARCHRPHRLGESATGCDLLRVGGGRRSPDDEHSLRSEGKRPAQELSIEPCVGWR